MSGSHEKLPLIFWVQIALVIIVGMLYLFMPSPPKEGHGESENKVAESTKNALKPIGEVAVATAGGKGGASRSGEEIVKKTCMSCHATGIANAPKMDESGKAAWTPRMAGGLDALVASAKKGKGAMPPNGADPSLSEEELKSAIVFMLGKTGIEVDEGSKAADTPVAAEAKSTEAPDIAASPAHVQEAAPKTPAQPEIPPTPAEPITPEQPKQPQISAEAPAPAAPASPDTAASQQQMQMPEPTAPAIEAAPKEAPAIAAAPVAPAAPESAPIDLAAGEKVYKSLCFSCHEVGVANAPKPGNKEAWAPRIAKGMDTLFNTAINGDKAMPTMPAKGGNPTLSDDDVKAAVAYMVELSK